MSERIEDHVRMSEALSLAQGSLVNTSPNPRVGCVIYSAEGRRLGAGVTAPPGGLHAEVSALSEVNANGERPLGATVYVTLEPCSHHGRTPPCADALIQAGVGRVVIGALDPNPLVSGRGVERLKASGVEVEVGVEGEACARYHAPFFKWVTSGRPWVTLKGAMTLDGCLATASGDSKWITGLEARTHVHALRAQSDAIMVGGETARLDRPRLNVRLVEGSDPTPVLLSRELSLPRDLPCARPGGLLFAREGVDPERVARWRERGLEVLEVPLEDRGLSLPAVLDALGERGVTRLLVEGGGRLHGALLEERLADELKLYIAPKLIGRGRPLFNLSSANTIAEGLELKALSWEQLGDDLHLSGRLTPIKDRDQL
jgi:diaminohydroxyphosphoribosylaminopyrimidine deaminase/5-amino-6-(5-phosphoribosylamino)uracil reductase